MFDDNAQNFSLSMNAIMSKLKTKSYVNNQFEIYQQLKFFVNRDFKHISLLPSLDVSNPNIRKFSLVFEKQSATGELIYIPPKFGENDRVGSYTINIYSNSKPFSTISFKRMSEIAFLEHLKNLNLGSLFEDLWTKIMRIFKEVYAKQHNEIYPNSSFVVDRPAKFLFNNPKTSLKVISANREVMSMAYIEDKNKWTVYYICPQNSMSELRIYFMKDQFNSEVMRNFFEYGLGMQAVLVKSASEKAFL